MFNCVCFPRVYLITSFDLTSVSPGSHICGNPYFWKSQWIVAKSISHLLTLLLGLMMNSCFSTRFHSSFPWEPYNVMSTICVAPFFSGILSLRYPDTNWIWISVRYGGWNIFPGVMTLVFIWPGKMMPCLAHLAGGPIVIVLPFSKVIIHSSMRKL